LDNMIQFIATEVLQGKKMFYTHRLYLLMEYWSFSRSDSLTKFADNGEFAKPKTKKGSSRHLLNDRILTRTAG